MASIDVSTHVSCPPRRVRALLLDRRFLQSFVDEQHPTSCDIAIDSKEQFSEATWDVVLPSDVPSIVKKLVGGEFTLRLWIHLKGEGRLEVDAAAKGSGRLRAALTLQEQDEGTFVRVQGTVEVNAGLVSGQAANLARDQVIKPVLNEDLFRLLQEWCSG